MSNFDTQQTIDFIRENFQEPKAFIPLHEPRFWGEEKEYVLNTIESTFVSSVGEYVTEFENRLAEFSGVKRAVAVMNGTAALHMALMSCGVQRNDLVLTQSLTFVATCNAISYIGAQPCFVDVDRKSLNICPIKLKDFLDANTEMRDGSCYLKTTEQKISAIVVMHTFGHMAKIDEIVDVCKSFNIKVVEDAAEALGSFYKDKHAGNWGDIGILSFNGNKVITTGGGGALLINDEELANKVKHLTTTAKLSHAWEFKHDQVGYNYRMPNLNAALGCAQLNNLTYFLEQKRKLAQKYIDFFKPFTNCDFFEENSNCKSNYWLNVIILENYEMRNQFLEETNSAGVMTRPIWELMSRLPMFKGCPSDSLEDSEWLADRLVNIPSSVLREIS